MGNLTFLYYYHQHVCSQFINMLKPIVSVNFVALWLCRQGKIFSFVLIILSIIINIISIIDIPHHQHPHYSCLHYHYHCHRCHSPSRHPHNTVRREKNKKVGLDNIFSEMSSSFTLLLS